MMNSTRKMATTMGRQAFFRRPNGVNISQQKRAMSRQAAASIENSRKEAEEQIKVAQGKKKVPESTIESRNNKKLAATVGVVGVAAVLLLRKSEPQEADVLGPFNNNQSQGLQREGPTSIMDQRAPPGKSSAQYAGTGNTSYEAVMRDRDAKFSGVAGADKPSSATHPDTGGKETSFGQAQ